MHKDMRQQVGGVSDQRLARQLEKLKGIEKSEIRMIEADRRRFRMKYRKRYFPKALTDEPVKDSKINDSTVLGRDEQTIVTSTRNSQLDKTLGTNDYEAARSLIFTGGKVDLDKILCLHLLSVHVIDIDEEVEIRQISYKNEQSAVVDVDDESENSSNDILACYVVEIQQDESQFHKRTQQEEVSQLPEGQLGYRQGGMFASRMPAPNAAGKMPIVSPRLYNNLLESSRGNAKSSTARKQSLEHLQKYIYTGQISDKSDEKSAGKLQRAQSSSHYGFAPCKRSVCKNEKYFICSESSSAAPKSARNQYRNILICVNTQLKNFVQTIMEILRNINIKKAKILSETLKNSKVIATKLSEMENFISSLENYSFIMLPENYICIPGYAAADAHSSGNQFNEQPVAETLILESDVSVFNNILESIRLNITDFLKKSKLKTQSIDNNLDGSLSTISISQSSAANQTSSKMSLSVRKSVDKVESINESAMKSYDAIQQEFNEKTSAQLPQNIKKSNLYTDPDRVILRRMTNSQRILVGQMCAALKTRKINNEGLVKEKIPLPALLKPVLSRESINYLTQGTIYAKGNNADESKVESNSQICYVCVKLTDFILTKIYHEVIEMENLSQLQQFMNDTI